MSRIAVNGLLICMLLLTPAACLAATAEGSPDASDASGGDRQPPGRAGSSDEFDGTSLDQKWSWYNSPASSDVGVTTPGHLHMVARRLTNFSGTADSGALLYQTMNGSYSIETKIRSSPQNNFEKAGIMIRQNATNWVALKYQAEGGAKVEMSTKVGGSYADPVLTPLTANPVYLRLERAGSTFTSFYSTNGTNWTQQWTGSAIFNDSLMAGLVIADGNANTDYAADFEYFRVKLPNQPPGIKSPFAPVEVKEDERLGLKVFDHFSDPDGDNLTFKVTATHIMGGFNNATSDLEIYGAPNWFGVENAFVTASDPLGAWVQATVNVTVVSVEDPPFLDKSLPNVTMDQNSTSGGPDLSKYFADNDTQYGDRLSYGVSGTGALLVNITPAGKVALTAPIGFWGTVNMTFTATDRTSLAASGVCKVTVNHVNQAPQVKAGPPDISVNEDESVTLDLSPVFWDPDGDPITVAPSGNVRIDVTQQDGTLNLTFKPMPDASAFTEFITLTAKDDKGLGSNYAVIKVTVNPVNDPPRITSFSPAGDMVVSENQSRDFSITAIDPESGSGVNITWSLDGQQVMLGVLSYTYRTNFTSAGNHTVTVSVNDGELTTVQSWNVTVLNVNREPADLKVLSPKPGESFIEGANITFDGSAQDVDGDALEFTWLDGARQLGKGRTLALALPAGAHSVALQVHDGTATVRSNPITITVKANSPPLLTSLDPSTGWKFQKGARIEFKAVASDPDGDPVYYCWTENGILLSSASSFHTSDLAIGSHQIHLAISDGKAATEANVTVEITQPAAEGLNIGLLAGLVGAAVAIIIIAVVAVRLFRKRGPPVAEAIPVDDSDWDMTSAERTLLK